MRVPVKGPGTALALSLYAAVLLYPYQWSLPRRMENHAERTHAGWRFEAAGLARSSAPAKFEGGRFDVTVRARPFTLEQYGPARIFTISKDPSLRNLTLGQSGADLILRVRAPGTTRNGTPQIRVRGVFRDRGWHALRVRVDADTAELFLDGRLCLRKVYEGPVTSRWDPGYRIALGNELSGRRPWLGEIEYAGPLDPPERYWALENAPRLLPFRGADAGDLLVNFLGFIPLGLLLARLGWSRRSVLYLCACLSLGVELAQLGLVDRFSSTTDVLLNAAGGWAGALLASAPERLRARHAAPPETPP